MEFGESLEDTLLREIHEESGLEIEMGQLMWVYEFIEKPYHAIEFYFKCEVVGGNLIRGLDPELEFDQQMLLDLTFVPFNEAGHLHIEPKFIKDFCKSDGEFFSEVRHIKNTTFEGGKGDDPDL